VHFARRQRPSSYATVILRSRHDAQSASAALRQEMLGLEPDLILFENLPYQVAIGTLLFPVRVGAILLGAFGVLALTLASIGLYGVIAYAVSRRTREIGVRMALGADRTRVLSLVLRQGLILVGLGILLGGALALAGSRLLASVLYGVGGGDPPTYLVAAVLLAAVALVANLVPALRAARVDPLTALRQN
jgi:ABC-type antimicrobial peptide transport system permease subunit